jgi:hypothetical protein
MPTPTYTPLANLTLASSATSCTFSSISQSYRDLVVVVVGSTTGNADITAKLNNATDYSFVYMAGSGSGSGLSGAASSQAQITLDAYFWRSSETSSCIMNIMDYSATDKHKTILSRNNVAGAGVDAFVNRWNSTAAVTQVSVSTFANAFAAGTTFALYGIAS